ncbi:hypothetical protein CFI10_01770 [Marinobacterium iners]|uniref:hypothetical protein n=1 Tax=Marinobacterium iners TaxID=48076 RepID=UPI001A8C6ADB|nr:hypothetical protein [Marinobacterium iners]QSR33725.1 hypothetical protein CFI10_01770 [Marinobacterium iners]
MNAITQVSDRECLIAHFSEISAEVTRLNCSGAYLIARFMPGEFSLDILSPIHTGPLSVRVVDLHRYGLHNRVIDSLVHEAFNTRSAMSTTHRYTISLDVSLSAAEPVIEQIFRHLASIHQNPDACNVFEEVAA